MWISLRFSIENLADAKLRRECDEPLFMATKEKDHTNAVGNRQGLNPNIE
jgi:hypothetical protein